jgi:hypothetical protein
MLSFSKHSPYAARSSEQEITCLGGRGTPGEMLSLSFSISSTESIDNVQLAASALRDSDYVIPASSADMLIVKVWKQAGIGVYQSAPASIAELLVKDDRSPIHDGYSRRGRCGHLRHVLRRSKIYIPPDIRMDGNASTALPSGEYRQIWLSLRIPPDAPGGVYSGYVEVTAGGRVSRTCRLPVQIEVLPFDLLDAAQDLFIWYKGTLDCHRVQNYVTEEIFRAQLQDVYDTGFRSISINESNTELLQKAINIADSIGFRRNVVLTASTPDALTRIDFRQLTPVYYVSDEIDARDDDAVGRHVDKWTTAQRAQARTMASLVSQPFSRRLLDADDLAAAPDVFSYYLPPNVNYFLAHAEFQTLRDRSVYYYWQSHMEKPDLHRVLAGLYLWKSKADGIAPYCYQHLPVASNSPFDDFDDWDSDVRAGAGDARFKDHMTTYPARHGSIPTLQWKGLADGIYDLRYLTTFESWLKAAEESRSNAVRKFASEARLRCDSFLERISLKNIDVTSDTSPAPYKEIDSSEYGMFRAQLTNDILAMMELTGRPAADS